MKKAVAAVVCFVLIVVGGWFAYTNYQLKSLQMEEMRKLAEPRGHLGFWNPTDKLLTVKVTYENGDIRWVTLSGGGGHFGSFRTGALRIERTFDDQPVVTMNIVLEEGGEAQFDVYEDRFELR